MSYAAAPDRYEAKMQYRRCGRSGLDLPVLSLGHWHNFGDERPFAVQRAIARRAFDLAALDNLLLSEEELAEIDRPPAPATGKSTSRPTPAAARCEISP